MTDPNEQDSDAADAAPDETPLNETTPPMELMEKAAKQVEVLERDDQSANGGDSK